MRTHPKRSVYTNGLFWSANYCRCQNPKNLNLWFYGYILHVCTCIWKQLKTCMGDLTKLILCSQAFKSKTFKTKRHYFQHLNDYRGLFVIKALSWLSKDYCCTNLFLLKSTRLYWGLTFASFTSLTAYDVVSGFSYLVKTFNQQSLFWLHQVQVKWCYGCVDLLT